jgi:hypothetical protein
MTDSQAVGLGWYESGLWPFVKWKVIFPQHLPVFLLECFRLVMGFLIVDVTRDGKGRDLNGQFVILPL